MLVSLAVLLCVALFVLTLPGTIELAMLTFAALLPRRRRSTSGKPVRNVRLGVIIPVYNEEESLASTVASVLSCDNPVPPADIIVQACNCSDGSVALARKLGCTVLERIDPSRRGKGYGLNHAFRMLAGKGYDAYLILDADTLVDRNFLDVFRSHFASGADAGQCTLRVANGDANMRTRLMRIALQCMTFLRPLGRHRLGLSSGIFGNGFGVSAKLVEAVPYECYSIAEDLEYHMHVVRSGRKVVFLPQTSVAAEMVTDATAAKPQRARWEGGRLRVAADHLPGLVRSILGGKLRLIEPMLELLLLPIAYHTLLVGLLGLLAYLAGAPILAAYAGIAMLVIVAHVVAAMVLSGAKAEDWKALLRVPGFVVWKIVNLPGTIRAARKAAPWVRTTRIAEQSKSHVSG